MILLSALALASSLTLTPFQRSAPGRTPTLAGEQLEVLDFGPSGGATLSNGRELSLPFSLLPGVEIEAQSASGLGACVFDSDPFGPNASSSDRDLLVDRGNVLILQERPLQSTFGVFDFPDDDAGGGRVLLRFGGDRVAPRSIDLIDVCPAPDQELAVVLIDENEFRRTYLVPAGWTEDVTMGGAGVRTLDLTTLAPQPGFASLATASEQPFFDPGAVLELEVRLSGSGAIDDVTFVRGERARLNITSCSLSCQQLPPFAVFCGSSVTWVNRDLCFDFNQPLELSSVTPLSFQVLNVLDGRPVPGTFLLDPDGVGDESKLCFRPALTFDSSGDPIFAFEEGGTYLLRIQGTAADLGPFVLSRFGEPLERFFSCTILTTGVLDLVPGPPRVEAFVDVVTSYDANGQPDQIAPDQPADGALYVSQDTSLTFRFDDLMIPTTILDSPGSGLERIEIGLVTSDGPPAPIAGTVFLALDQVATSTTLVFLPAEDLPAGRSVSVRFLPGITDFAGNELIDPGEIVFTVESPPSLGRRRAL